MNGAAFAVVALLVFALVWVAIELRSLQAQIEPIANSPLVRGLSSVGT